MNIVDIAIIVIVLLCGFMGFKKGVMRELIQLVGVVLIVFLAFWLKDYLANFIMKYLPFFHFKGIFMEIPAINILVYQMLAFVVIFIIGYCLLGILIDITNIMDKVLKFSIILAIPDKILGLIVGLFDGIVFAFLLTFVAYHISPLESYINDSKIGNVLLERTPFIGPLMTKNVLALEEINKIAHNVTEDSNIESVNAQVIQSLLHYNIISKEKVEELIASKKISIDNIMFN